jgi:hypothetical protein
LLTHRRSGRRGCGQHHRQTPLSSKLLMLFNVETDLLLIVVQELQELQELQNGGLVSSPS